MLGLNEIIDQLAMVVSVGMGCIEGGWSCL